MIYGNKALSIRESDPLFEAKIYYIEEKTADSGSMSVRQVMTWYTKIINKSKTKAETKEEIDNRIKVLEEVIKTMKSAKITGKGRIEYALKGLIPGNNLLRYLKNDDIYGIGGVGLGIISGVIVGGSSGIPGIVAGSVGGIVGGTTSNRFMNYNNMLDERIKASEEAINYLKEKRKEL